MALAIRPQWSDQTWLLYAAGRVLDGARLGLAEVAEPNPPLIIWMLEIPVWIARAVDIGLPAALQACLAVLVAVTTLWSARLVAGQREARDWRFAGGFTLALLFATVIHPWVFSGQREHIMVLLVLPYLLMAAGRMEGRVPAGGQAVAAGLLAAIGFLLKPHHLLVVLGIEVLILACRREFRSLWRLEVVAMTLTGLFYLAAILVMAPEYVKEVLPLALITYDGYHRAPLSELILPMRGLKLAFVVLLAIILRRWLVHRALVAVLLVAGLCATLAYVAQLKGYQYQFLPAIAYFNLLLGVIAVDCWLTFMGPPGRTPRTSLVVTAGALAFVAAIAIYLPMQRAKAERTYTDDRAAILRSVGQGIPAGSPVLILSTSAESFFEEVLARGLTWGSRFMCLWMLPAIVNAERAASRDGVVEPVAIRDAAELTRSAVASDVARWKPNPVLVERCQDPGVEPCRGLGSRLDVMHWLELDPGFVEAWMNYTKEGSVGPYDLWCRKGESDPCRRILTVSQSATGDRKH